MYFVILKQDTDGSLKLQEQYEVNKRTISELEERVKAYKTLESRNGYNFIGYMSDTWIDDSSEWPNFPSCRMTLRYT